MIYLVTGAARGLGLEFVKQLSANGHIVIATVRNPHHADELRLLAKENSNIRIITLDTTKSESVKAAIKELDVVAPNGLDFLINNSGVSGSDGLTAENTTAQEYLRVFETNVVGTSNVTQAFLPFLHRRNTRRIINITSILGSVENTTDGYKSAYRVSKAAENMLTKVLAGELKKDDFVVVAIHPGWVQTDMGGKDAPITARQSISGMLERIENLKSEHNGTFFDFEGKALPW
ncbi:hypothetical protein DFQ28_009795 [Apophysomyces sp. BC1034]|nr:hypothetical protein DFQ30_009505 [Apophysomyces sp. BC1015]KAG0181622.1 hypothetical protein DFQ29_007726 [Apophysomyces sp. BC1021]KAG0192221.1 hypothetical protein DFQ28_009795 [Apophysomyces sp. BC1034]